MLMARRYAVNDRPIYVPSQIMRLVKAGKIADPQPRKTATIYCEPEKHVIPGDTESPRFWENGMYLWCAKCGRHTLARVAFASFILDLRGERKRYPLYLDKVTP
jgi:hypothetical protein